MTPVLRRSCGYPNKAAWWRFVFYLLAVVMGIDLGCSPGGFGFRASDFITGGGLAAGLLLRRRSVGASFVSDEPAVVRLQFAPLLPLLARLLISVQRFTSILVGPRWWLLQLNQGLESAIGGSGGAGVGGGDRPGHERKKMYRSPRDFLVGFEMIDAIAEAEGISVSNKQFKAIVGKGLIGDVPVMLAKPQPFMNASGEPVGQLVSYFKIPLNQLVVIYDDLDLPFAELRLLPKGGHGGHNGYSVLFLPFPFTKLHLHGQT
ncbi:uncharacterized protein LOC120697941 isoform X4 [Panicum virgatum]|uniref:uncharacterized protein LOC120697941 isoform X4 n=1 Tax=Panicum virgatum TaxID=38727 RepID=UPI0019D610E3|nr:uncharacterized protein LOC120697941 isoform X4 [Panicum virgatum]